MMNFVLQTPSLQHLAGLKIVAALWNQPDIMNEMKLISLPFPPEFTHCDPVPLEWMVIEERVKDNFSALPLPRLCKKQLLNLVEPIGTEIMAWCQYHDLDGYSFKFLDTLLPQQLYWTMHGTIDYAKTADFMVKDESLDIEIRYELACVNCLEDEGGELFESMSAEQRQECVNRVTSARRMDHRYLLSYFTCTLRGDDTDQLNSFFQSRHLQVNAINTRVGLCQCALLIGDGGMCEYLCRKLKPQRKKEPGTKKVHLMRISQEEMKQLSKEQPVHVMSFHRSRVSWFLHCCALLNEEQQRSLFREDIYKLLMRLLGWPMQSLFMEAVKCWWSFVDEYVYSDVLCEITRRIAFDFHDYDYTLLFWECWRLSPADYKHHYLNDIYCLELLFATRREEFIQFIFNQAPSHQLKELVENRNDRISQVLMDESVISNEVLMESKETAALNSSNEPNDVEKRLRSEHLSQLIDIAMESRI